MSPSAEQHDTDDDEEEGGAPQTEDETTEAGGLPTPLPPPPAPAATGGGRTTARRRRAGRVEEEKRCCRVRLGGWLCGQGRTPGTPAKRQAPAHSLPPPVSHPPHSCPAARRTSRYAPSPHLLAQARRGGGGRLACPSQETAGTWGGRIGRQNNSPAALVLRRPTTRRTAVATGCVKPT
jgi:hypothetical protein